MENEIKSKSKGLVVTITLLIIIVLGLVGYICYDKGVILSKSDSKEVKNKNTIIDTSEEELDVNSRLVQNLYHKVTWSNGCAKNVMYDRTLSQNANHEFDIKTADEKLKMEFVRIQLSTKDADYIECSDDIPDTYSDKFSSECKIKKESLINGSIATYSKEVVERIYKDIFGSKAELDTSVNIGSDFGLIYIYNQKLNKYIPYSSDGGAHCITNYSGTIEKAVKTGKELKLYENESFVTHEHSDPYNPDKKIPEVKGNNKYVYTFMLDDDGMYSFISRKKA